MTVRVDLSSEAQTELAEAIRWYEARRPGIGDELLTAIDRTFALLARQPELGTPVPVVRKADARRVLVPHFPYQIVYQVRVEQVVIIAVAHLKRRPGYWKSRR